MSRALLSLGSNLGDREAYLKGAIEGLAACAQIKLLRQTRPLDNPALLFVDQGPFLNQLVEVETSLSPEDLLGELKRLELALGRQERFRYGPREIDLDILWFEGQRRDSNALALPHPALESRAYIRELLSEWELTPEALLEAG